jgi:hypothetical protein
MSEEVDILCNHLAQTPGWHQNAIILGKENKNILKNIPFKNRKKYLLAIDFFSFFFCATDWTQGLRPDIFIYFIF